MGILSAHILYPIAEKIERRTIGKKLHELKQFYFQADSIRSEIVRERLADIIEHASHEVPYYKDLFSSIGFDPKKIRKDIRYLDEIPFLSKDIIREQGERMLSRSLGSGKYFPCKTGGSTGASCTVHYDQNAADYSAAVTLFSRAQIGKNKSDSELHFACRFPGSSSHRKGLTRDSFKSLAMHRSNIFFDRLDEVGLDEILKILLRRKPFLVHAHPSTIYALACYVKKAYGKVSTFSIFESSGELLASYQREMISNVFGCQVIDRYGLAEFGILAYQIEGSHSNMRILESEGYVESVRLDDEQSDAELVVTGFRNKLMPLIRYRTGDLGEVVRSQNGPYLINTVGRIHDQVPINGVLYPTHHIQDVLDHRIGCIQDFQIDLRVNPPILRVVPESPEFMAYITSKIREYWGNSFNLEFIKQENLIRVGHRSKFRYVIQA